MKYNLFNYKLMNELQSEDLLILEAIKASKFVDDYVKDAPPPANLWLFNNLVADQLGKLQGLPMDASFAERRRAMLNIAAISISALKAIKE